MLCTFSSPVEHERRSGFLALYSLYDAHIIQYIDTYGKKRIKYSMRAHSHNFFIIEVLGDDFID